MRILLGITYVILMRLLLSLPGFVFFWLIGLRILWFLVPIALASSFWFEDIANVVYEKKVAANKRDRSN